MQNFLAIINFERNVRKGNDSERKIILKENEFGTFQRGGANDSESTPAESESFCSERGSFLLQNQKYFPVSKSFSSALILFKMIRIRMEL